MQPFSEGMHAFDICSLTNLENKSHRKGVTFCCHLQHDRNDSMKKDGISNLRVNYRLGIAIRHLLSHQHKILKSLLRLLPEKQTLKRIKLFFLCVCVCMCVKCSMIKGVSIQECGERNYR